MIYNKFQLKSWLYYKKYNAKFIEPGWMGLIYPWFYCPADEKEDKDTKSKRIKELNHIIMRLR